MAKPLVVLENVVKVFKKKRVLDNIFLQVRVGEVYALIGPNGAGKTTTLRIITGIYRPDKGRVTICGEPPATARERRCIGYLPEDINVYERLTGYEHLRLILSLYAPGSEIDRLLPRAVEYTGLEESDLNRRAGEYSKGMRRRIFLAALLALKPPLLVLDEPTSGLDIHSAVMFRRMIKSLATENRAVLVTSHNMLEVERLATRVGFIFHGRIIDEGDPKQLVEKYNAMDLEEAFVKATSSPRTGPG